MAVGKTKRLTKGGKEGAKKKDWHDVKAWVTRTQGDKIASDGLEGHVFEASLTALQSDDGALRKFKLITEHVQGKTA